MFTKPFNIRIMSEIQIPVLKLIWQDSYKASEVVFRGNVTLCCDDLVFIVNNIKMRKLNFSSCTLKIQDLP